MYGTHLGFEEHKGYYYANFVNESTLTGWNKTAYENCRYNVLAWQEDPNKPGYYLNDTKNMWISIGTLFSILIGTHVLVSLVSKWKSEKSFKQDEALLQNNEGSEDKRE